MHDSRGSLRAHISIRGTAPTPRIALDRLLARVV
jgi:hypothetical protein